MAKLATQANATIAGRHLVEKADFSTTDSFIDLLRGYRKRRSRTKDYD